MPQGERKIPVLLNQFIINILFKFSIPRKIPFMGNSVENM